MNFIVVIPARMQSSRLPGKPLIDLKGKSMIQRTFERVCSVVPKEKIIIATDHESILSHCNSNGMKAVMTSSDCLTGTDRVAEIAKIINADFYINVQGDEPLMNPSDIEAVIAAAFEYPDEIINGYAPINEDEWHSTSIPKVVISSDASLLYMSRSPIPGNKNATFTQAKRQVCVYSFPKDKLLEFASVNRKTPLEEIEDLELLRFLELGHKIRMIPLSTDSIAVDTPQDVAKVLAVLNQ